MLNWRRKHKAQTKKQAFSVVELAIALGIVSILFYAASSTSTILMRKSAIIEAQSLTKSSPVHNTTDLLLWLETSLTDSFKIKEADNGENISTWYDLSPNQNHASQNVQDNQPEYVTHGINNVPSILFGNTIKFLTTKDFIHSNNFTCFLVFKKTSVGDLPTFIRSDTNDPSSSINWLIYQNGNNLNFTSYEHSGTNGTATTQDFFNSNNNAIIATIGMVNDDGKKFIRKNSVLVGEELAGNLLNTQSIITISSDSSVIDMEVSELILFERSLGDIEINNIEKYLSKKYNITLE